MSGAGPRLAEFFELVWPRVRPGGLVLVHSSLTNQLTREWLEGMRGRQGVGGGDADDGMAFETLSLREPHKLFQNSFSVFQKRGDGYGEPILTKYP